MKALLLLAVIAFSTASCNKKGEVSKDSYEYFSTNLKPTMMYTDIVATFGSPDGEKGSGIHIYYYNLQDGTSIWIGYAEKIIYAQHMLVSGSNAVLLHTLI